MNVLPRTIWTGVVAALTGLATLAAPALAVTYTTSGNTIRADGSTWVAGGINSFDQFGVSNKNNGNIKINRVVVDCMQFCPIYNWEGAVSTDIGTLHPLETIVQNNRDQGQITVLAMFGWNDTDVKEWAGSYPAGWWFWNDYKSRLRAISEAFAGQSDVWIDPWNEPYDNNVSFTQWKNDMTEMYNTIRAVNGNIIIIPGRNWSQNHDVLVSNEGKSFLSGKTNLVAGLHAYYEWISWDINYDAQRIDEVRNAGWPLIFGEVGYLSGSQNPDNTTAFLNLTVQKKVPTLAWSWSSTDGLALWNGGYTWWGNHWNSYLPQYTPPSSNPAPIGKRISMKASITNRLVQANMNNSSFLQAHSATTAGTWERFDVVDAGNGEFALKSVQTGKYVTCDLGTTEARLRCDWATTIQGWEKFRWENLGSGVFAIKSSASGKYVSVDNGITQKYLKAQWAGSVGNWEKFTYTVH